MMTTEKAAHAAALSPLRWKPLSEAIARRVTRSGDSSGARFSEQTASSLPPVSGASVPYSALKEDGESPGLLL